MKVHSDSTPKKFYRSRLIGDLGQRSLAICLSTFSKAFSSEATWAISIKFHMQPSGSRGKKIYRFGPGHMTKMATMPYIPCMVKTLKNLLFKNQWADCLETWYRCLLSPFQEPMG